MKRWLFPLLIVGVIGASMLIVYQYYQNVLTSLVPHANVISVPRSAYKYNLCSEAFAFAFATPDNPYKTDFAFPDPFRKDTDTITPRLLSYDTPTHTVEFSIVVTVPHVSTFHMSITRVHELDGISISLPDAHNRLQRSSVPQVIISSFGTGGLAVLDYTCPDQWVWKPLKSI